jgi:hypothetical protein
MHQLLGLPHEQEQQSCILGDRLPRRALSECGAREDLELLPPRPRAGYALENLAVSEPCSGSFLSASARTLTGSQAPPYSDACLLAQAQPFVYLYSETDDFVGDDFESRRWQPRQLASAGLVNFLREQRVRSDKVCLRRAGDAPLRRRQRRQRSGCIPSD